MQITMALHRAAQQYPDRVATIAGGQVRTYAESADRVARLAAGLGALGVNVGDRVGILSLNSDRYHEFLLAVPWAGAVVNPVNTRWSTSEMAYSLVDCETSVLFVDDAFLPMVPALQEQVPNLSTVIFCGDGDLPEGLVGYEQLLSENPPAEDQGRGGDDLYGVFYTGGTTGFPKGVMLSHDSMVTSAMGSLTTMELLTRGGRLLHAAPMFHLADIAAWNIGMLTGSTHVMVPSFTPAGVVAAIQEHGVTDALLVPTMIQMLVDGPDVKDADLSSLRKVLYGASVISDAVLERARKVFPAADFTQAYGMTELAPIATLLSSSDHADDTLRRSCGRAAAHVEVRVVDPEDREVARRTVGEIVVRGDNVMMGYWNQPEESATVLRGGWMHTGDGGYMDEDGYLFIADRIKDMIITGGENVYSAEVENALAKHDAVAACAVIGVPDQDWGERVHAVVVLRADAVVTPDELRDFCRGHLANYKVPRSVAYVEALPVSGAGKILKRELRAIQWDDDGRQVL